MRLNKTTYQHLFNTYEDIRYGITACLWDHEIFAFITAFGIKWAPRDVSKCQSIPRSIFNNVNVVHKMVRAGYIICLLGEGLVGYQGLRHRMGEFVQQGRYDTQLKLFLVFVKFEVLRCPNLDTGMTADGYKSISPAPTQEMLAAVQSDNPMISITLLNSETEREDPFPYIPSDLVRQMVQSEHELLFVPAVVLSESRHAAPDHFDFEVLSQITLLEPFTYPSVPVSEDRNVHLLFDLDGLPGDALQRGNLHCYQDGTGRQWDDECRIGITFLETSPVGDEGGSDT